MLEKAQIYAQKGLLAEFSIRVKVEPCQISPGTESLIHCRAMEVHGYACVTSALHVRVCQLQYIPYQSTDLQVLAGCDARLPVRLQRDATEPRSPSPQFYILPCVTHDAQDRFEVTECPGERWVCFNLDCLHLVSGCKQ
jgi:hypothetical protein